MEEKSKISIAAIVFAAIALSSLPFIWLNMESIKKEIRRVDEEIARVSDQKSESLSSVYRDNFDQLLKTLESYKRAEVRAKRNFRVFMWLFFWLTIGFAAFLQIQKGRRLKGEITFYQTLPGSFLYPFLIILSIFFVRGSFTLNPVKEGTEVPEVPQGYYGEEMVPGIADVVQLYLARDRVQLNDKILDYEDLSDELKAVKRSNPDAAIEISTQKDLSYAQVADVLELLREIGLDSLFVDREEKE